MAEGGTYVGRLIGSYRLTRRIGEGGMGEVYVAERENEFRKRVAVKLIRTGMASPEVVRRFVIERQTLAALNHPHIVRLVDGGTTEDGLPYLVEDYVEGQAIDRYCDSRQLRIRDRLTVFVEVCQAVHHAHQSLIVHCDLKPGNILVTAEGVPMLLDFGIAKLLDPGSIGISAQAAQTRQRAFTPEYASPEQLRGEPVTTATDIYALGVILYELMTGHSPYRVASTGSLAAWIRSVCEQDAEPPSVAIKRVTEVETEEMGAPETVTPETVSRSRGGDPQTLRRYLRGDLDAIVLKALRKEAQHRYGSVDQMADDIVRHLAGKPVLARKSTTTYVVRKFFGRHKLAVAAALLLLLTLAGGLAATLWEARLAARRFEDVRHLAHTFLFDVHDSIQDLPGSTPARSLIAKTGTDYLNRLARDAQGDRSLQLDLAEGYLKIGDVEGNPFSSNLGDGAKSIENYQKAIGLAESLVKHSPADQHARQVLAQCYEALASILPFHGRLPEAVADAKQAVALRTQVSASDPSNLIYKLDLARAYEVEGDVLGGLKGLSQGHSDQALAAYQQSFDLLPQVPANSPEADRVNRGRAVEMLKIADMLWRTGNNGESIAKYQMALRQAENLYAAEKSSSRHRGVLTAALNRLAFAYGSVGDLKAAEAAYKRSAELDEESAREDPTNERARTNVAVTQKNLGDLYYYQINNMPEALACYKKATEVLEAQSREDPDNLQWQRQLSELLADEASILVGMGQKTEGFADARRSLLVAKQVADRPGATADQIYNYAWLAVTMDPSEMQDPKTALPYAIKGVEMTGGKDPTHLHVLALAYAGTGDFDRAIDTEQKALALFPPAEPGKPAPRDQGISERALERFRKHLKNP
jgi:non-specific serine/threonine protein kinase/serine/threonine-protein kinase